MNKREENLTQRKRYCVHTREVYSFIHPFGSFLSTRDARLLQRWGELK